jgi:hypothetical protein
MELGAPLPAKKDVQGLFNAVKGPLGLSPDRSDLHLLIAGDVRTTLGGLATVIQRVGALRTHAGDAHGTASGAMPVSMPGSAAFPFMPPARLPCS